MKHLIYTLFMFYLASCNSKSGSGVGTTDTTITVTATAFNSIEYQTNNNPKQTAWQDTLKPSIKAIAVSRDLLVLGLGHNTEVHIEGLPGTYLVKDKMAARWVKRIDIYMDGDIERAKEWGEKEVAIRFDKPTKKTQK